MSKSFHPDLPSSNGESGNLKGKHRCVPIFSKKISSSLHLRASMKKLFIPNTTIHTP
ncbi:hypothetical protein V1514DRAFT_317373, partial [Lipomyces japonicus]|uniref:uncharacterized protein n=1 Tax=Lipomyces japonicus TaxID=56871 RepID=UPI0034CEB248